MGKSSSQVVGYRYYAKFAVFIGNRIEKLISINFDKRGWVKKKTWFPHYTIDEPDLYGENEGGIAGVIYERTGLPNGEVDPIYQAYQPLASGYPYQSYLIFSGLKGIMPVEESPELQEEIRPYHNSAFYLGNSGYMKEMLLWVKRTRVRNDGRDQWYEVRGYDEVVCEIGTRKTIRGGSEFYGFTATIKTKTTRLGDNPSESTLNATYTENQPESLITISRGVGSTRAGSANLLENREVTFLSLDFPSDFYFEFELHVDSTAKSLTYDLSTAFITKIETLYDEYDIKVIVIKGFTNSIDMRIVSDGMGYSPEGNQELPYANSLRVDLLIKKPVGSFDVTDYGNPDINPIHKIREILTDDTAMGKPESDVNDTNFIKAANRIWDDGLGISWAIDEKSCIDAIEELCYHIEAGVRVNRQTGLYEMVLFRDDWFAENEIHAITENKIKDLSLEVMNSDDIVNQLNVTYYDRERIKNSTFSIYENGSILTMGHANAESVEFPYFMNMRNAEIVANWKLKQFSTPAWSGSFSTGWKEARKWNRYDLIRLPWSKKWNGTILARIMKINLGDGTNNTVTIDFEEVIPYSGEMNTSIVVDTPVDTAPQPPQPSVNAVFEAPYYLTVIRAGQTNADLELSNNPNIGYVAAIAAKPQSNSLNALLYTDGGVGEFEQASRLDYCDILQLDQSITKTASAFVVTGSLTQTANSNNLILLNDELMGFVSFDDETKVLTVKRGVLDTVPKNHSIGSLFIFDLPDVAFDSTQYAQSEIIEAKVLTTTPSGIQESTAAGKLVEIQARAIRPYPPANVKINDEYWPERIEGNLVLTWSHRNRVQQTGGVQLGWYESSVMLESGVTYIVDLYDANNVLISSANVGAVDTATIDYSSVTTTACKIKLYSLRDGYESFEAFEHELDVSFNPPYNLNGVWNDSTETLDLTWDFD